MNYFWSKDQQLPDCQAASHSPRGRGSSPSTVNLGSQFGFSTSTYDVGDFDAIRVQISLL